jgi:hypothetical protein
MMVTVADLGFGGMRATMVFRSRASRARATAGVPSFRAFAYGRLVNAERLSMSVRKGIHLWRRTR